MRSFELYVKRKITFYKLLPPGADLHYDSMRGDSDLNKKIKSISDYWVKKQVSNLLSI